MNFAPRTFRCPNCNEMINDSMKECRYCSVPVDPGVAQLIADKQQQANQACSDASYLRTASIAMYVFLVLSLVPFVPLVTPGFYIVFVVVVVPVDSLAGEVWRTENQRSGLSSSTTFVDQVTHNDDHRGAPRLCRAPDRASSPLR